MAKTSGDNPMFNDPDAWMRTKPMSEPKSLFYVCKATDTVKDLPWTENRAKSVSTMFHKTRREALIDLKSVLEQRVQNGVCRIMEIEREIANDSKV